MKIEGGSQTIDRDDVKLKKPKKYHVMFHNDDFTPFEFVEEILMKVFRRTSEEAEKIAKDIDKNQKGVAGTYTKDLAETKAAIAHSYIKETEYPLLVTTEKE